MNFNKQRLRLALLIFALFVCQLCKYCDASDEDNAGIGPSIYLTVNPVNYNIDINWFDIPLVVNSSLGDPLTATPELSSIVYITSDSQNPIETNFANVLFELPLTSPEGQHPTILPYDFGALSIDAYTTCYSYYFFLYQNSQKTLQGCMRANANWMSDMYDVLKDKRIQDIFIPGTFHSACYPTDPQMPESLIARSGYTQDDNIMSQLLHGIRYLDLRVGYYPTNVYKFWANNGTKRLRPLSEIFKQVKDFMDASNEIVIVDFTEFPVGFKSSIDVHRHFAMFLTQELGDYAAHPGNGWDTTLDEIWRSGLRIIVQYQEQQKMPPILRITQQWGNVNDGYAKLEASAKELRENISRDALFNARPFVEIINLTPEAMTKGDISAITGSRYWEIMKFYHGEFGRKANILSVHKFYRVVDIARLWSCIRFGFHGLDQCRYENFYIDFKYQVFGDLPKDFS